ncbi:hypothetical protein [Actinomadura sp. 6N118]|uniref:hypothetical protein n=1 Tax=Actinomadura sp. 6N118 TaxID=3375151 RepID=UPI00379B7B2B
MVKVEWLETAGFERYTNDRSTCERPSDAAPGLSLEVTAMSEMTPETVAALKRASQQVIDRYMTRDPNINGVGLGFRRRAGTRTDEPVVVVLVTNKQPEALIPTDRVLPKTVEVDGRTWGVDVKEGGPFSQGASVASGSTAAPRVRAAIDPRSDVRVGPAEKDTSL